MHDPRIPSIESLDRAERLRAIVTEAALLRELLPKAIAELHRDAETLQFHRNAETLCIFRSAQHTERELRGLLARLGAAVSLDLPAIYAGCRCVTSTVQAANEIDLAALERELREVESAARKDALAKAPSTPTAAPKKRRAPRRRPAGVTARQIEALSVYDRVGSYSKTAVELGITRPAATKLVKSAQHSMRKHTELNRQRSVSTVRMPTDHRGQPAAALARDDDEGSM